MWPGRSCDLFKFASCSFYISRQVDSQDQGTSLAGLLFKLSLTAMVGGAAAYYVHARNPNTIPNLIARLRPQMA